MSTIDRRRFIKTATAVTVGGSLLASEVSATEPKATIYVVHGKNTKEMLKKGIEKMGGWSAFVAKGKKATVKPNAAWKSRPEQGGNTDPILVGAVVAACKAAGASEVIVPENTCSSSEVAFKLSGIADSVKTAGGRIYSLEDGDQFRRIQLTKSKKLDKADVAIDVLDTGCLINLPVAKHHSGTTISVSMKNWMGSVKRRKLWHLKGVEQCIADLSTFLKPKLIIVDATRIMTTNGPQGPGVVERPEQLIFGSDPVAVDAYAATLFKLKPFAVEHIKIAHEMKIGCGDLDQVEVVHINT